MKNSERIQSVQALATRIDSAKQQGQRVVFTNGCFDVLHAGHLSYLEEARALGDMLVVAVNSDASVQAIKGPTRPINSQDDRMAQLAALRCVDYVCYFDEDDPRAVIDVLKPSLHVKGGDYDPEAMPETPMVRAHGGEVKVLPMLDGYSNSKQFKRIHAALEEEASSNFQRADHIA